MNFIIRTSGAVIAIALLAGCGTMTEAKHQIQQANEKSALAERKLPTYTLVKPLGRVWLSNDRQVRLNGDPLPEKWEQPNALHLADRRRQDITRVVALLEKETGLRILISGVNPSDSVSGTEVPKEIQTLIADAQKAPGTVALAGTASAGPATSISREATPSCQIVLGVRQTKLSEVLGDIAAACGYWWRFEERRSTVTFSRELVRTFTIATGPIAETSSTTSVATGIAGSFSSGGRGGGGSSGPSQGSSSGSGSGQLQTIQMVYNSKFWSDLLNQVKTLTGGQAKVDASSALGIITVAGSPAAVEAVGDYIARVNDILTRHVNITLQFVNLDTSNEESFGVELEAALSSNGVAYRLAGQQALLGAAAASLATTVIEPADSGSRLSRWNGSEVVFRALNQSRNTTNSNGGLLLLRNKQVGSTRATTRTDIVYSVERTSGLGNSGAGNLVSTARTPASLETGFTVSALPTILDDGQVIIDLTVALSELRVLRREGSAEDSIQLPTIGNQDVVGQVMLRSGAVAIVPIFNGSRAEITQALSLGGSLEAAVSRQRVLLVISPEIQHAGTSNPES